MSIEDIQKLKAERKSQKEQRANSGLSGASGSVIIQDNNLDAISASSSAFDRIAAFQSPVYSSEDVTGTGHLFHGGTLLSGREKLLIILWKVVADKKLFSGTFFQRRKIWISPDKSHIHWSKDLTKDIPAAASKSIPLASLREASISDKAITIPFADTSSHDGIILRFETAQMAAFFFDGLMQLRS